MVPTLSKKLVILITVIVVVVVVFGIISIRHAIANREYKGYEVLQSVETSGDNIADYIQYGNSVLKITKDGTSYIDKNGNTIWDCSYAMKMPKAKVSGDYAVVADMNGRDVYLFDKTGKCKISVLEHHGDLLRDRRSPAGDISGEHGSRPILTDCPCKCQDCTG